MYVCMCMAKRGDDVYVMPDLVSVFPFPQILFLQYSHKIALQATFLILSQPSLNELNHSVTAQP